MSQHGQMLRVEYQCPDGRPFPVEFADPEDVELRWAVDREHAPSAMTPLADSVRRVGGPGAARSWEDCHLVMPSTLARVPPDANGYDYYVTDRLPAQEQATFQEQLASLVSRHGDAATLWRSHSLPRIQEMCAWLQAASSDTSFRQLAERRECAWGHTTIAGVAARRQLAAVTACIEPFFGDGAELVAFQLAQGSTNDTISADAELWDLARIEPGSDAATGARERFLAGYGGRTTSWSIDHPTLAERPELIDTQLDLLRRADGSMTERKELAEQRRDELAAEIRGRFDTDAERDRFDRRIARLETFIPIREARARWQLIASGALRTKVLERGAIFASAGVLEAPGDVFFLTPEEYDEPHGDLSPVIVDRKADHRYWSSLTPPIDIGATTTEVSRGSQQALAGTTGSPGVANGVARVILDLAEADRFQPGDVLITTMTSPAWTPLFALAAAVVTDSGDALSHVAIAAREYGIPCVVGTDHATTVVTDGSVVTVNGKDGTVVVGALHYHPRA